MSVSITELQRLKMASPENMAARKAEAEKKALNVYIQPRVKALAKLSEHVLDTLREIPNENLSSEDLEVFGPTFSQQALEQFQVESRYPSDLQLTAQDVKDVINNTWRSLQRDTSHEARLEFEHRQLQIAQSKFLRDTFDIDVSPESMAGTNRDKFKFKKVMKSFQDIAIMFKQGSLSEIASTFVEARKIATTLTEVDHKLFNSVRRTSDIKTMGQFGGWSLESFKEGLNASSFACSPRLYGAKDLGSNCIEISLFEYLPSEQRYRGLEADIGLRLTLDPETNFLTVSACTHGEERGYYLIGEHIEPPTTYIKYSHDMPMDSQDAKDILQVLTLKSDVDGILAIKRFAALGNQPSMALSENLNPLVASPH